MSIESWREEFYPTPAQLVAPGVLYAAKHSLKKWIGLRQENLDRHKVAMYGWYLQVEPNGLVGVEIGAVSCALCAQFFNDNASIECAACPLYMTLGRACDDDISDDDESCDYNSPWAAWLASFNPEPMIAALDATVKRLEAT